MRTKAVKLDRVLVFQVVGVVVVLWLGVLFVDWLERQPWRWAL